MVPRLVPIFSNICEDDKLFTCLYLMQPLQQQQQKQTKKRPRKKFQKIKTKRFYPKFLRINRHAKSEEEWEQNNPAANIICVYRSMHNAADHSPAVR